MSVTVVLSCDHGDTDGTCPAKAFGRPGEDIDATIARAVRAGWIARGLNQLVVCPWHGRARHGGTGPL